MGQVAKKIKIKINSKANLEEILQELYDEACKNIVEVQNQMNKLSSSVQLNDEIMDGKVKYAKAMNDYISNKNKAINTKLDIAKVLNEVIKYEGNVKKTFDESEHVGDWGNILDRINDAEPSSDSTGKKVDVYHLKK